MTKAEELIGRVVEATRKKLAESYHMDYSDLNEAVGMLEELVENIDETINGEFGFAYGIESNDELSASQLKREMRKLDEIEKWLGKLKGVIKEAKRLPSDVMSWKTGYRVP